MKPSERIKEILNKDGLDDRRGEHDLHLAWRTIYAIADYLDEEYEKTLSTQSVDKK